MNAIRKRLKDRGGWLAVTEHGEVKLLRRAADSKHHSPLLLLDINTIVDRFATIIGDRERFTAPELQQVAGCSYRAINAWTNDLDLLPVVSPGESGGRDRLWDVEAAFAFGLAGAMRRFAQPLSIIKAAIDVILDRSETPETVAS